MAKGGTNLIMPRGAKVEPWPRWLSKTFVNVHVLQEDAIELRDNLLGAGRDRRGRLGAHW